MQNLIRDYEWKYMMQMVARLGSCRSLETASLAFFEQLKTLIPYYKGVAFRARRMDGRAVLSDIYSTPSPDGITDHSFFTKGDYPHWSEFIMNPSSTVFRQSDIIGPDAWERTRIYRDIWLPQNIYWGMMICVVAQDKPLAILSIHRGKDDADFSEKDRAILEAFKTPLEEILGRIIREQEENASFSRGPGGGERLLTRREAEIAEFIRRNVSDEQITESLCISRATLNKHISNIYAKTGAHSRTQLCAIINAQEQ